MKALIATGQCSTRKDVFGLFHHLGFDELHAAWVIRSNHARWFEFEGGMIEFRPTRKDGSRGFKISAAGEVAVKRVHDGLTSACTAQPAFNFQWRCEIQV